MEESSQQIDIKEEYETVTIDDSEEENEEKERKHSTQDFCDIFKHESIDISCEYSTNNCFCYRCGLYSNSHVSYDNECLFEHKHQIPSIFPQRVHETNSSFEEYTYLPSYQQSIEHIQYYKNQKETFSELLHNSITESLVCNNRRQLDFSSDLSQIKICETSSIIRSNSNLERSMITETFAKQNNDIVQASTQDFQNSDNSLSIKTYHMASFACPFCPKMFLTKILLNGHTQYDCENKKIFCKKCHTRFTTNTHLMRHQMSKTCTVKPFECVGCKNRYVTRKNMKRHQVICTAFRDMTQPPSFLYDLKNP